MLRGSIKGVVRARAVAVVAASVFAAAIMTTVVTQPAKGQVSQASRAVAVKVATPQYVAVTAAPAIGYDVDQSQDTAELVTSVAAMHEAHINHLAHEARLAALAQARQQAAVRHPAAQPATSSSAPQSYGSGYSVTSSFQQCVIRAESGGNAQIWNASGHYGLYQFSYSTWVAHGGDPSLFGHASAAYQTQVFLATVAADGTSDWAPYDGC